MTFWIQFSVKKALSSTNRSFDHPERAGRVYPSEARVVVNRKPNKAMADQLTTVSKLRLINRAGRLGLGDMRKVEQAIKVQLDLIDSPG